MSLRLVVDKTKADPAAVAAMLNRAAVIVDRHLEESQKRRSQRSNWEDLLSDEAGQGEFH